ncbi:MAG: membrane protein [Lysobacteraceae bacterium]|nr:MAG: membrane protein [Xanthomonadaceae bacterium]
MAISFQDIIDFWFDEIEPKKWFVKDATFDQLLIDRFSQVHRQAAACELWQWRAEPLGRLAEVIVLDQFSRNMFRGKPASFAFDTMALTLAQEAVASGAATELSERHRYVLYMPYMHSESPRVHEEAVRLFTTIPSMDGLKWELKHKEIIDRFGRYPHRNEILGRPSTVEEKQFLAGPGSSF